MIARAAGIGIAVLAAGAPATLAAAQTLCRPDEAVVFSCPAGARTASLCAAKPLSRASRLQYRFGGARALELAYPDPAGPAADAFIAGDMMFAGGGGAWLRFVRDGYAYTVFTAIGRWGAHGEPASVSGVAVAKDGKAVANLPCRSEPQSLIGPDLFETLGLKTADPDAFEIPDAFMPR